MDSKQESRDAKIFVAERLRKDHVLKDEIDLELASIEAYEIGDMVQDGEDGLAYIAEQLQKGKTVNKNNKHFIAAAKYLMNTPNKLKEQRTYEETKKQDAPMSLGNLIANTKTAEILKVCGVHPETTIPFTETEYHLLKKEAEEKMREKKEQDRKRSQELYEQKVKQQEPKKEKTGEKQKAAEDVLPKRAIVTFIKGEATHGGMPVSWPASERIGVWMMKNVVDPSFTDPVKIEMEVIKSIGRRTIVMKPVNVVKYIDAVFIQFANTNTFYALHDMRKINVPRKAKHHERKKGEYLIDDFKKKQELWGTWKLQVIDEDAQSIFATPVEKIADRDVAVEDNMRNDRFMQLYNVNQEEFFGTYEIYAQGRDKVIYVNTEAIAEDAVPRIIGEQHINAYMDGQTWLFRLANIIFDKDGSRIPVLKPIKQIKKENERKKRR